MKTSVKYLLIAVVLGGFATISLAGEALQQFEAVKGRTYHADLYEANSCDACHDNSVPSGFPADFVCLDCHGLENLVETSARPEKKKWQNPHNNLHYGKDVPCMECHGEHQVREPLCNECHKFAYPEHKS